MLVNANCVYLSSEKKTGSQRPNQNILQCASYAKYRYINL